MAQALAASCRAKPLPAQFDCVCSVFSPKAPAEPCGPADAAYHCCQDRALIQDKFTTGHHPWALF